MTATRTCTILISLVSCSTLFFMGCGQEQEEILTGLAPSASCESGTAVILVGDGYLQNMCGCVEPDQTIAYSGTPLNCTVGTKSSVIFEYENSVLFHQITSRGSPAFQSSPLSNPRASLPLSFHAVEFPIAGTYQFFDAFNTDVSGNIIVQ